MRWTLLLALSACSADSGPSRFQLDGSGLVNCALEHSRGTAACWGSRDADVLSDQPRVFGADLEKIAVDFGAGDDDGQVCGVRSSGAVFCWSTNDASRRPVPPLDEPAVDIAAGEAGTCVVLESGSVECWGDGDRELEVPADLQQVLSISVGVVGACALVQGGTIECFGSRDNRDDTPASLDGFVGAVQVSSGISEACVLDDQGDIECWGPDGRVAPVPLRGTASRFETIYLQRCAANRSGAVRCVGGSMDADADAVLDVPRLPIKAQEVSGGWMHTCAAGEDGVWCWGLPEPEDAVQIFE